MAAGLDAENPCQRMEIAIGENDPVIAILLDASHSTVRAGVREPAIVLAVPLADDERASRRASGAEHSRKEALVVSASAGIVAAHELANDLQIRIGKEVGSFPARFYGFE